MIYRILVFALIIGFIFTGEAFSQKYNIKRYSVNEGLPSGNVYDVHIDDMGYLWFGTAYGLVRHDGSTFITYGTNEGLKDDLVYDIYYDDGDIWVSTELGGVAKFDYFKFEYVPELAILDTMVVNYITSNNENELWFGTNEYGVFIWDKSTNEIESISKDNGLPSNQIWDIYFDEQEIWISTMLGVSKYNREEQTVENFTQDEGVEGSYTYQVVETADGRKWIPTSSGITIINTDGSLENINELDGVRLGFVYNLIVDNDNRLWVASERQGLFILDDEEVMHIKKANGLSSNFVYRLVKDGNGTIWITTDGDGVSVFKDMNFKLYDKYSDLEASGVFSSRITSDGTMWLGTDRGLSSFKDGEFTNYNIPEPFYQEDEIWDIEELPNGNLLLLTYTYDVIEFDGRQFFRPAFYEDVSDYYINDIMIEDDGSIFFSSFEALLHLNGDDLEVYTPPNDEYWKLALGTMFRDSRGMMWIATEGGVAKFENGEFEYFTSEHGVTGNNVYEITEDAQSNLWIGSSSGISILMNEQAVDGQIMFEDFYNTELFTKETIFLQFDENGGLWQGTNAGINFIDLSNWRAENYSFKQIHFPLTNHGTGIEFNGPARVMDEEGTLWFGSNSEGLISFNFTDGMDHELIEREPPTVYLRSVSSNDIVFYDQRIAESQNSSISIDYDSNDLNFRINAVDFINPNNISVRYLLDGFDDSWNNDIDIDEIRYTNLPSGDYTLRVSARSTKSEWSTPVSLISFTVKKPFYLTYSFLGASFLIIVGVIYGFIKSRISRLEKVELQNLVDKQTNDLRGALEEKEVLIKEIHHRVKNNLAVVSGLLELQGFRIPQGPAKQALVESRMRVIAMSKIHENLYQNSDFANVDFGKFINDLVKGVQATFNMFDKNIEVIQHIDRINMDVNLGVPIGLITNELLSNCYKHAFNDQSEGTITVSFFDNEHDYILEVKDDGKGSDTNILEIRKKSLGMSLIKSLSSQVKGDLQYSGESGSHFILTIPKNVTIDF